MDNTTGAPQNTRGAAARGVLIALVAALTILAYLGTLGYQFVYDDQQQIVENQSIQSWHYVGQYFTRHLWSSVLPPTIITNYYRPLFLLWLLINHTFFGLHPLGWHVTTLAAHVAVTMMVYMLALKFVGDRLTACIAAAIFGLHPVHIESVAWISGGSEPLLALLLIPSFLCYLSGRQTSDVTHRSTRSRLLVAASVLLYAMALLAKETAIVLPAFIVAYEWIFGPEAGIRKNGRFGRLRLALLPVVPFLFPTVFYLIARGLALKSLSRSMVPLAPSTIVLTWPSLVWFYIRLLVWPVGLSEFYDTPYVGAADFPNVGMPLLAILLSAAAVRLLVNKLRDRFDSRVIKFMSVWMLLPILPLLDLRVFRYGDIAHDRYLYLPSIGFSIIVALLVREVRVGRWTIHSQPAAQVAAIALLLCLLGAATAYQSPPWASNVLLYDRGMKIAPQSDLAANNFGVELKKRELYSEAASVFMRVIERNPDYRDSVSNLGFCYYDVGRCADADRYLTRAIEIDSRFPDPYICLGLTRQSLHRIDEAEALIRRAIEIQPDRVAAHRALGDVLKEKGDLSGALGEYKTELAYHPDQLLARDQVAELEAKLSAGVVNGATNSTPASRGVGFTLNP